MALLLYNIILPLFALGYICVYLFKGKFHKDFRRRLGILPDNLKLDRPVWVHAVSVGEMMSVRNFVEELRKQYFGRGFVISTVTPTGNKIAEGIAGPQDFVTYLPLDFSFVVSKVIRGINPSVVIIAETEIWPNFISCLHRNNIPVIVVNARISDRSFNRYKKIRFLIRPVLNKINLFCAQTEMDARRLMDLGVLQDKIKVAGNLKFDAADYSGLPAKDSFNNIKLGLNPGNKLLVAGSTHPGEEKIILTVYRRLLKEFSGFRLLIAPRHPERSAEVAEIIAKYNFCSLRISQLIEGKVEPAGGEIFILDSIGRLIYFYGIADIVFIGGSLVKKGGHNILEPASLEKPVIFGPYMFNFRDISDLFVKNKAGVLIHTADEFYDAVRDMLFDPGYAAELGNKARQLIEKNQGATHRSLEYVSGVLK